jgi:phthalate 4,5-dioxygenase oxygenase subunit
MLSKEHNEKLVRVSAGTPMGDLLREFWLPVLVESELVAGQAPQRLRVLGEDLVAFKGPDGKVGVLSAYCAHRCAPLWYGGNEVGGLRCTYHGWKYDADGRCVDMPNERASSRFEAKVRLQAYPTALQSGLVWIYMGTRQEPPALPVFDWTGLPSDQVYVGRWLHQSNWLQGLEGEIDNSHVAHLHRPATDEENTTLIDGQDAGVFITRPSTFEVPFPTLMVRNTGTGVLVGSRRETSEGFHWRVTRWWPPSWNMVGNPEPPFNGRVWVPVDDNHTVAFTYLFHPDRPLTERELAYVHSGMSFPPSTQKRPFVLPDGYTIDVPVPVAGLENDYLIDREAQASGRSTTGIRGMVNQDRSVQEAMRSTGGGERIVDRTLERLGSADVGIIGVRRALLRMADEHARSGTIPGMIDASGAYRGRSLDVLTDEGDFDGLIGRYAAEIGDPEAAQELV